jgi:hypothetical protein
MSTAVCSLVDVAKVRGVVRNILLDMRQQGLREYDLYMTSKGGVIEADDRADVHGFSRPTHHCPEKYRFQLTDPDIVAKMSATERIQAACAEILGEFDNVRVMVHLSEGGNVVMSVDIPGEGEVR